MPVMMVSPQATAIDTFSITINTANPNRDGTGTITAFLQFVQKALRAHSLRFVAVGATSEGMIRLYTSISGTKRLLKEIPVEAKNPGPLDLPWSHTWHPLDDDRIDLVLDSATTLHVSTHNADEFECHAFAAELPI